MGVLKTTEKITAAQLQHIDNPDCSQSCHHHIGDQSYLVPHIDNKIEKFSLSSGHNCIFLYIFILKLICLVLF